MPISKAVASAIFGSGNILPCNLKIGAPHKTIETIFRPAGPWAGLQGSSPIRDELKDVNQKIIAFRKTYPSFLFKGFVPNLQLQASLNARLDDMGFKAALSDHQANLTLQRKLSLELRQMHRSNIFVDAADLKNLFDYLEVYEVAFAVLAENNFKFHFDCWDQLQILDFSTYNRLGQDATKFGYLNSFLRYLHENYKTDLLLIDDRYFCVDLCEQRKIENEYSKYLACSFDRERLYWEYLNWRASYFKSYDEIDDGKQVGAYKILKRLRGKGAMGVVTIAEDRDGKKVVLKVPNQEALGDSQVQGEKRLIREGRICYRFVSPYNVKLLDMDAIYIKNRYVPVLIFEYVEEQNLDEYLEERGKIGLKKLEPQEVIYLMLKICLGLIEAHDSQVIHKDLKNGNLIIDVKKTDLRGLIEESGVKIIDYGIAAIAQPKTFTAGLSPLGTFPYSPPEQYLPGTKLMPSADIFTLGIIMRMWLTGSLNEDESLSGIGATLQLLAVKIANGLGIYSLTDEKIGKNIPPELREIIKFCLRFEPEVRPQNAADLFCQLYDCPLTPPDLKKAYAGIIAEVRKKKDEINQKFGIAFNFPPLPSASPAQGVSKVMPITFQPLPVITGRPQISPPVERGLLPVINFNPQITADIDKIICLPRRFRILLSEDNLLISKMWKRALVQINNIDVTEASNAGVTLDELLKIDYDFMISDITKPGMDGLVMLNEIKSHPLIYQTNSLVPVLILTNRMQANLLWEVTSRGGDDCISKSNISPRNLKALVASSYFDPWIKLIAERIFSLPLMYDPGFFALLSGSVQSAKGKADKTSIIEFVEECLKSN